MSAENWVALVTAAIALGSVWVSTRAARATARLQDELHERRAQRTKEQAVEEIMARYREPLLRAAFDLQSRIYNIIKQHFLGGYYLNGRPAERSTRSRTPCSCSPSTSPGSRSCGEACSSSTSATSSATAA